MAKGIIGSRKNYSRPALCPRKRFRDYFLIGQANAVMIPIIVNGEITKEIGRLVVGKKA